MILVFDLDDTLYEERTYVLSGFRAVAGYLKREYKLPYEKVLHRLTAELKNGRGRIFDNVLGRYNLNNPTLIKKCLSIYRLHKPKISLHRDAVRCLERFRGNSIYIVTDGNKIVQANKIAALKLNTRVNRVFITHRFGLEKAKPSPYCFMKIMQLEKTTPDKIVYIGDNPTKDFVGIKPFGFKTIRILRGNYKDLRPKKKFKADIDIIDLDELKDDLFLKM